MIITLKHQPRISQISAGLDVTFKNTFSVVVKSERFGSETNRVAYYQEISENTLTYLEENYFESETNFYPIIENDILSAINSPTATLDLSFLSTSQEAIARPFLEQIMSLEDLTGIDKIIYLFEKQVTSSTLSEEHKYQLFSMASLVKQGAQTIRDAEAGLLVARTQKIDVKAALRAGVVGLAIGAVGGAKVGCAGGTVVFPGLGTASGCVGGAVIGGAIGFIAGVGESILTDLLFD